MVIDSVQGHVTLHGIVINVGERAAVEQVAAGVPGVAGVDNQLRQMTQPRLSTSPKT